MSGTFTHNGQGGYTFTMHVVGGENAIEGSAYRLVCDDTSCHHAPPFGPVTVVATSGGDSGSAVTDADGHYEIKSLGNGSWHVEPHVEGTLRSLPGFRDVNIQGDVDHAETGVDFNVCDERPAANIPNGCAPVFDYSMPDRFDKASLSRSYTNPSSFTVLFELKAGCDSTASYAWYVDGKQAVDRPGGGLCKFLIDFDKEGTYKVRVDKQDGSGEKVPYVSTVVVQDFLIVSLGDSLATGEGNPPYNDYSCDQSPKAYGAQAASKIEDADPRSSVTFVQLACSGASIDSDIAALPTLFVKDKGLLSKIQTGLGKKAVEITQGPSGANSIAYQLAYLKDLIGDRQIDALTLSIGINNLDFGTIVKDCILVKRCQAAPDKYGPITLRTDLGVQVPANMKILAGLYSDLRETITALFPRAQLNPSDVYVVGYPDPLHNETGALCPIFIGTKDAGGFENLDKEDEVTWAENAFMTPLERATSDFAAGWNYVGLGSLFDKHGYCSTDTWFNQIQDFTDKRTTNPSGILHPTATGQGAIVDELLPTMKSRLFFRAERRRESRLERSAPAASKALLALPKPPYPLKNRRFLNRVRYPLRIGWLINIDTGLPSISTGSPSAVPIHASRRPAWLTGGARSALLVVLLAVFAPTELSLGDPVGELVLHRSGLVAGFATEALDGVDARCSGRARRVPAFGGCLAPSSRLGRLAT